LPGRKISFLVSAARFAVPYIFGGRQSRLENIDRCTALASFLPPLAAVGALAQQATPVGLITRRSLEPFFITKKNTTRLGGVLFGKGL